MKNTQVRVPYINPFSLLLFKILWAVRRAIIQLVTKWHLVATQLFFLFFLFLSHSYITSITTNNLYDQITIL